MKGNTHGVSMMSAGLLALVLLGGSSTPALAQEDPEELRREVAEEKARLEQQMQRLEALEQRLEAALAKNGTSTEAAPAEPVEGEETGAQEQEGEAATDGAESGEVVPEHIVTGANETRDPHAVMTGAELVASDFPGSWPLFGTGYRMKIGGYFKIDALYDLDGAGDKYEFLISQIPVEGTPEAERSGYFNMFVRETRFNFDVRKSPSDNVAQQFFLEMDFFDESSLAPRLRHAYIVYGNLLAGQTWTTVAELASLVYTLDFAAGDALFGTRAPQIRWQQQVNPRWSWAVGLEMLQSAGIYNPLDLGGAPSTQLPVLAARLTHQRSDGIRTLAAMVQQLRWDGEGVGPDASAVGWAAIFGGRQNFASHDFFTWNLAYGDGTADTIMALTGSDANAVLTNDGRLITRRGYSAVLGLGHKWSDALSTNLAYAWTDLQKQGDRAPDAIQSGGSGHVNLIWAPAERLSTGVELIWGNRENADGATGEAARLQTMIKYGF